MTFHFNGLTSNQAEQMKCTLQIFAFTVHTAMLLFLLGLDLWGYKQEVWRALQLGRESLSKNGANAKESRASRCRVWVQVTKIKPGSLLDFHLWKPIKSFYLLKQIWGDFLFHLELQEYWLSQNYFISLNRRSTS